VCERIAGADPRGRLDGRHETILAARGCAVRNSLEHLDAIDLDATDLSGRRVRDRVVEFTRVYKTRPGREVRARQQKGCPSPKTAPTDEVCHGLLLVNGSDYTR